MERWKETWHIILSASFEECMKSSKNKWMNENESWIMNVKTKLVRKCPKSSWTLSTSLPVSLACCEPSAMSRINPGVVNAHLRENEIFNQASAVFRALLFWTWSKVKCEQSNSHGMIIGQDLHGSHRNLKVSMSAGQINKQLTSQDAWFVLFDVGCLDYNTTWPYFLSNGLDLKNLTDYLYAGGRIKKWSDQCMNML